MEDRLWLDSQLNGAIVVDPVSGSPPDRILLLSEWFHPYDSIPNQMFDDVLTINGKAWPHRERLTLQQGDSTRFRILNAVPLWHPRENTDLLAPGGTMTLSFVPTTPGNWLFHCHFSLHMDTMVTLSGSPRALPGPAPAAHPAHGNAAAHQMRGLVMALHVTPAPNYVAYNAIAYSRRSHLRLFSRGIYAAALGNVPVPLAPQRAAPDQLRHVRRDHCERQAARRYA